LILKALQKYEIEDLAIYNLKVVGDLWGGKSPYKYYAESQEEYSKVEPDIFDRA
jgi:hypothetical protein